MGRELRHLWNWREEMGREDDPLLDALEFEVGRKGKFR